jgi:hypothetical protein
LTQGAALARSGQIAGRTAAARCPTSLFDRDRREWVVGVESLGESLVVEEWVATDGLGSLRNGWSALAKDSASSTATAS